MVNDSLYKERYQAYWDWESFAACDGSSLAVPVKGKNYTIVSFWPQPK